MRALVVYESMFGNTRDIAEAIGAGLRTAMEAEVVEVAEVAPTLDHVVSLLVVGGPTHAFSMSREQTRASAREQIDGEPVSDGPGLREWLGDLSASSSTLAAAFDTRVARPRVPGSAAVAARRRLARLGLPVLMPAESFDVEGMTGPLATGELERARRWGEHLAARATAPVESRA